MAASPPPPPRPLLLLLPLLLVWGVVVAAAAATDTLRQGESLTGAATLVSSPSGVFEVGFFAPDPKLPSRLYLGIWYRSISPRTVVWVANRARRPPRRRRRSRSRPTASSACSTAPPRTRTRRSCGGRTRPRSPRHAAGTRPSSRTPAASRCAATTARCGTASGTRRTPCCPGCASPCARPGGAPPSRCASRRGPARRTPRRGGTRSASTRPTPARPTSGEMAMSPFGGQFLDSLWLLVSFDSDLIDTNILRL